MADIGPVEKQSGSGPCSGEHPLRENSENTRAVSIQERMPPEISDISPVPIGFDPSITRNSKVMDEEA